MATQLRSTTIFFFFFLFSMAASSSAAMAAYTPPTPGTWKDVADARTSPLFVEAAKFAAAEHNKQSVGPKLVSAKVLEGQVWATKALGVATYQFLMEARTDAGAYKVYRCVVSRVVYPNAPMVLRSFEAVLP